MASAVERIARRGLREKKPERCLFDRGADRAAIMLILITTASTTSIQRPGFPTCWPGLVSFPSPGCMPIALGGNSGCCLNSLRNSSSDRHGPSSPSPAASTCSPDRRSGLPDTNDHRIHRQFAPCARGEARPEHFKCGHFCHHS